MQTVDDSSDPPCHIDSLDVGLDQFAELLRDRTSCHTERERLSGIEVEEDACKDHSQNHVELLLGVNAVGVVFSLQRERENVRGEMNVRQVTNTAEVSYLKKEGCRTSSSEDRPTLV